MKLLKTLPLCAAVTLSLISTSSADIFVKFTSAGKAPAIVGDSTTAGHLDEVVALTFKAGVFQKGQELSKGSGAAAGKSEFRPVTIFKYIDKASPGLFMACAVGSAYKTVTLSVTSAPTPTAVGAPPAQAKGDFFKITLQDVFVTDVNQDAETTDSSNNLVETVQLTYGKIFWSYTPTNPDGLNGTVIKGGFDVIKNKALTDPQ